MTWLDPGAGEAGGGGFGGFGDGGSGGLRATSASSDGCGDREWIEDASEAGPGWDWACDSSPEVRRGDGGGGGAGRRVCSDPALALGSGDVGSESEIKGTGVGVRGGDAISSVELAERVPRGGGGGGGALRRVPSGLEAFKEEEEVDRAWAFHGRASSCDEEGEEEREYDSSATGTRYP
jgi:hypothetical protein